VSKKEDLGYIFSMIRLLVRKDHNNNDKKDFKHNKEDNGNRAVMAQIMFAQRK
jgi:hypothetical protein